MCTVVYAPQGARTVMASLRDESPLRYGAKAPVLFSAACCEYLMPVDPQGGGSWLGITDSKNVIILLNGAFEKHIRKPEYRMSRGMVVKQLLESNFPVVEWMLTDLNDIEPFTLIVYTEGKLFRLVWDGAEKYREMLDEKAHYLFSSATLYPKPIRELRALKMDEWMLTNPMVDQSTLLDFFRSYNDPEYGFIMNRNEKVKTLSYTYISIEAQSTRLVYQDFAGASVHEAVLGTYEKNRCC